MRNLKNDRGFQFGYSYCQLQYLKAKERQAKNQDRLIKALITICLTPILLFIILI